MEGKIRSDLLGKDKPNSRTHRVGRNHPWLDESPLAMVSWQVLTNTSIKFDVIDESTLTGPLHLSRFFCVAVAVGCGKSFGRRHPGGFPSPTRERGGSCRSRVVALPPARASGYESLGPLPKGLPHPCGFGPPPDAPIRLSHRVHRRDLPGRTEKSRFCRFPDKSSFDRLLSVYLPHAIQWSPASRTTGNGRFVAGLEILRAPGRQPSPGSSPRVLRSRR